MKNKAVIATRGSRLALIQSNIVAEKLNRLGVQTELLIIKTKGDIDQTSPLQTIGGDGLFVRAIEQALISGLADIAVHSAKDLPYELADGLMIGCTPDEAASIGFRDEFIYDFIKGDCSDQSVLKLLPADEQGHEECRKLYDEYFGSQKEIY